MRENYKKHKHVEDKQYDTEEIKEEIKYLEKNENESTMVQNIWDAEKVVLRGMLTANNLTSTKKKKIYNQPPNLTAKTTR